MFTQFDEELARSAQVGVLVHQAIGELAAQTRRPSPILLMAAADRSLSQFGRNEARAHRQRVAGAVGAYFWHLLPPDRFTFLGAELRLGPGRTDLVWGGEGEVLVDEVKTGAAQLLTSPGTLEQVHGYLACGISVWGGSFLGVRLLSTTDPRRSLLVRPNGDREPLAGSGLVRCR
jgi:hypothetical protein